MQPSERDHPRFAEARAVLSSTSCPFSDLSSELLDSLISTMQVREFGPSEPLPVALECDDLNTLVRLSRDTGLLVMLPHQLGLQVGRSLRCISVEGSTTPLVAEIHAIWLRGRSLSPLAVRAIEMATALAPDFSGAPG